MACCAALPLRGRAWPPTLARRLRAAPPARPPPLAIARGLDTHRTARPPRRRSSRHPALATDPSLDIRDGPFIAPRLEMRRLVERVLANCASVAIWVGIWDQARDLVVPRSFLAALSLPALLFRRSSGTSRHSHGDALGSPPSLLPRTSFRPLPGLPALPLAFAVQRCQLVMPPAAAPTPAWPLAALRSQIDMNILPFMCSYEACGNCTAYGTFPCAWYKIAFTVLGLMGMFWTRQLYQARPLRPLRARRALQLTPVADQT